MRCIQCNGFNVWKCSHRAICNNDTTILHSPLVVRNKSQPQSHRACEQPYTDIMFLTSVFLYPPLRLNDTLQQFTVVHSCVCNEHHYEIKFIYMHNMFTLYECCTVPLSTVILWLAFSVRHSILDILLCSIKQEKATCSVWALTDTNGVPEADDERRQQLHMETAAYL